MKKPSEENNKKELRSKIIGLGEKSIRKSYYPELQQRIAELEKKNSELQREISVRKDAEKTNIKLEEQLRQSMKMEAIGTLAGGIAHDFNNILTSIIGYSDLAKMHVHNDCHQHDCPVALDLERILEAGHRAKDLIKQILTFSRQQKHEIVPLRLSKIVKEASKLLRSAIPKSVEIKLKISSDNEYVLADPTQMHQIVMNLCTNGYQAMHDIGGILVVNLYQVEIDKDDISVDHLHLQPGLYSVLEITDTGVGMSKEMQERIFDPYFTTKGDKGGSGMGLAVVHGIVREHKGHISVYSEIGEGTTFRVYLPLLLSSVETHVKMQQEDLPRGDEKILLVDDEEVLLDLGKALLEGLGYRVTVCSDPIRALSLLEKGEKFDLVLTDMTMPEMNGAVLTQKILEIKPETSIIICTGFSELINEEKAKALGAREYIMKPFILKEIAVVLRKVLDN